MKKHDLMWQSRLPGGVCLFLGEVTKETTRNNPDHWYEKDEPVYLVLHPTEGLIEDPSYYYMTLEEQEVYYRRRVAYEIRKVGKEVPSWLLEEITRDEAR